MLAIKYFNGIGEEKEPYEKKAFRIGYVKLDYGVTFNKRLLLDQNVYCAFI